MPVLTKNSSRPDILYQAHSGWLGNHITADDRLDLQEPHFEKHKEGLIGEENCIVWRGRIRERAGKHDCGAQSD